MAGRGSNSVKSITRDLGGVPLTVKFKQPVSEWVALAEWEKAAKGQPPGPSVAA
jgi:hypothetical protein